MSLAFRARIPLSSHTASLVACARQPMGNVEYVQDHVRIERMLFDGVMEPSGGDVRPDPSAPGFGLELEEADAARHEVR